MSEFQPVNAISRFTQKYNKKKNRSRFVPSKEDAAETMFQILSALPESEVKLLAHAIGLDVTHLTDLEIRIHVLEASMFMIYAHDIKGASLVWQWPASLLLMYMIYMFRDWFHKEYQEGKPGSNITTTTSSHPWLTWKWYASNMLLLCILLAGSLGVVPTLRFFKSFLHSRRIREKFSNIIHEFRNGPGFIKMGGQKLSLAQQLKEGKMAMDGISSSSSSSSSTTTTTTSGGRDPTLPTMSGVMASKFNKGKGAGSLLLPNEAFLPSNVVKTIPDTVKFGDKTFFEFILPHKQWGYINVNDAKERFLSGPTDMLVKATDAQWMQAEHPPSHVSFPGVESKGEIEKYGMKFRFYIGNGNTGFINEHNGLMFLNQIRVDNPKLIVPELVDSKKFFDTLFPGQSFAHSNSEKLKQYQKEYERAKRKAANSSMSTDKERYARKAASILKQGMTRHGFEESAIKARYNNNTSSKV